MIDRGWLNDRSEYQMNFVHGLRNPIGLHLQYALEEGRIVTTWTARPEHAGFPGLVHGGLVAAVLDDVMGRWSALQHRFMVTGRFEVRFRDAAPLGVPLRVEGWSRRFARRALHAEGRMLSPAGDVVAEARGTYLPLPPGLRRRMTEAWPGFAAFLGEEAADA